MCVCVCVCVCERERQRQRQTDRQTMARTLVNRKADSSGDLPPLEGATWVLKA